jgi:hypothetical protein
MRMGSLKITAQLKLQGKLPPNWDGLCRCFWVRPSLNAKIQALLGGWGIPLGGPCPLKYIHYQGS